MLDVFIAIAAKSKERFVKGEGGKKKQEEEKEEPPSDTSLLLDANIWGTFCSPEEEVQSLL